MSFFEIPNQSISLVATEGYHIQENHKSFLLQPLYQNPKLFLVLGNQKGLHLKCKPFSLVHGGLLRDKPIQKLLGSFVFWIFKYFNW